jgi:hypothetical protein
VQPICIDEVEIVDHCGEGVEVDVEDVGGRAERRDLYGDVW